MEGMRGEESVAELCRREGIHSTIYYKWLKDFMEAGKADLFQIEELQCYKPRSVQWAPQSDGSDSELKAAGNVGEATSQIADQNTFI